MTKIALAKAYITGFCKTAESCGVDPSLLVKLAMTVGGIPSATRSFLEAATRTPLAAGTMRAGINKFNEAIQRFYLRNASKLANKFYKGGIPYPPRGTPVFRYNTLAKVVPHVATDVVSKNPALFKEIESLTGVPSVDWLARLPSANINPIW